MRASAGRARDRLAGDGMSPIIAHPDVAAHAADHDGADRARRAPSAMPARIAIDMRRRGADAERAAGRTARAC